MSYYGDDHDLSPRDMRETTSSPQRRSSTGSEYRIATDDERPLTPELGDYKIHREPSYDHRSTPRRLPPSGPALYHRANRYDERDHYNSREARRHSPVRHDTAPLRPANAPKPGANPVLGIFGLSIRTKERDLEDEFSRYGPVEKVVIVYDQRASHYS